MSDKLSAEQFSAIKNVLDRKELHLILSTELLLDDIKLLLSHIEALEKERDDANYALHAKGADPNAWSNVLRRAETTLELNRVLVAERETALARAEAAEADCVALRYASQSGHTAIYSVDGSYITCYPGCNVCEKNNNHPGAPLLAIRDALRELVTLKDLKESPDYSASVVLKVDYSVRKPLAWEAAREALKGQEGGEG